MAEFPAMPIWTDSYLGDTRHLTAAQHGAYFLLLVTAWRTRDCALPNDDARLAKWAAMDMRTWLRNKPVLMEFWVLSDDDKWRQSKQLEVRQNVAHNVGQKSAAGKASALKRQETDQRLLTREGNGNPTNQNHNYKIAKAGAVKDGDKSEESTESEILPPAWQDIAEALSIPNDQIFASWRKFKATSSFPWQMSKWQKWVERERVNR